MERKCLGGSSQFRVGRADSIQLGAAPRAGEAGNKQPRCALKLQMNWGPESRLYFPALAAIFLTMARTNLRSLSFRLAE
jgi:hypothetical protein